MAARGGHTHVVKLLLESGAYVDDYDHLAVVADAVPNGNNNNSCRFLAIGNHSVHFCSDFTRGHLEVVVVHTHIHRILVL